MSLGRRIPAVTNPELSTGFQGRQRVLAAVVQAALRQAGYGVRFLGADAVQPGLYLGTTGAGDAVAVCNIKAPRDFLMRDAQACATRLNAQLGKAVRSANNLASARQGTTTIGNVPFAEVLVQCPNDSTLRALHRAFVG